MPELGHEEIAAAVRAALAEDIGSGDATSEATIPAAATANAAMVAREPLIVAGLEFATITFSQVDPSIRVERIAKDGAALTKGADLLRLSGPARGILSAERVALNFVQRLSGVASATAEFVKAIQGSGAEILDTRKTTPGWRRFEKYAVACGGGRNHRIGLFDLVMIKDNHLAALRNESPNAIAAAVQRAREKFPDLKVEVEADELAEVEQAVAAGADIILLDNMPPEMLREAVTIIDGRAQTEASGGVTLSTVHEIASTGVNFVSVGAITHSVRAIDIGLDFSD
jgi:nicotinate-nucleotide pyrophosphorylase (carboxylating)